MSKITKHSKNDFSLGEISPNIIFRDDIKNYNSALLKAENCFANITGSIENMPELEIINSISLNNINKIKLFEYAIDKNDAKYSINKNIKKIIAVFYNLKVEFMFIDENENLVRNVIVTTDITEDKLDSLSITQVENSLVVCSKGVKPKMYRYKELNSSLHYTFDEVDYWGAITDGPLKTIPPDFANKPADTYIGYWRKTNGKTEEPDNDKKILLEGYYYRVEGAGTDSKGVYSEDFLKSLIGGRIDLLGNQFKVKGYTLPDGTGEGIEGYTKQQFKDNTLIELIPLVLASTLVVPTFKDKVDANGNYVFKPGTSTIEREVYWDKFDINSLYYYQDIFKQNKYPSIVSFYRGRIIFASTEDSEELICFSQTNNYFNFGGDVKNDTSGFTQSIPSDRRVTIYDIKQSYSLLFMTSEGIWYSPIGIAISPLNSFLTKSNLPVPSSNKELYSVIKSNFCYVDKNKKLIIISINDIGNTYVYKEINTLNRDIINDSYKMFEMNYRNYSFIAIVSTDFICLVQLDLVENVFAFTRYIKNNKNLNIFDYQGKSIILEYNEENFFLNNMNFSESLFKNINITIPPDNNTKYEGRDITSKLYDKQSYELKNVTLNIEGECDIIVCGVKHPIYKDTGHTEEEKKYPVKTIKIPVVVAYKNENIKIQTSGQTKIELFSVAFDIEYEED